MLQSYSTGYTQFESCLFSAEFCGLLLPSCCLSPSSVQGDGLGLGTSHVVWATALPQGISICSLENSRKRGGLSF